VPSSDFPRRNHNPPGANWLNPDVLTPGRHNGPAQVLQPKLMHRRKQDHGPKAPVAPNYGRRTRGPNLQREGKRLLSIVVGLLKPRQSEVSQGEFTFFEADGKTMKTRPGDPFPSQF